jgi:hypothetical protein
VKDEAKDEVLPIASGRSHARFVGPSFVAFSGWGRGAGVRDEPIARRRASGWHWGGDRLLGRLGRLGLGAGRAPGITNVDP